MDYQQLKQTYSEDIFNFPLFFAFNEKQLHDGIKKLDCTIGNLASLGGGGYCAKWEIDNFKAIGKKYQELRKEWLKSESNLISAILSELNNYEYFYSRDKTEIVEILDLDLENNGLHIRCFNFAKTKYLESCSEMA